MARVMFRRIAAARHRSLGRAARLPALAIAVFAATLTAQEPFRTGVRLVRLDVSVLDRAGRPVRDLTAADFRITERGRPLVVRTFEATTVAGRDAPPAVAVDADGDGDGAVSLVDPDRPLDETTAAPDLERGRLIVIVMDDDMTPANPKWGTQAKAIARTIVEQMGPDDRVGVQFTRVSDTKFAMTSNRERIIDRIETYSPGGYLALPPSGSEDEVPRFWRTMLTLGYTTEAIAPLTDRRKMLVYIGPGLPIRQNWGHGYHGDFGRAMITLFREAERANVVVYTFDPTGLDGLEDYVRERSLLGARTMPTLGGRTPMDQMLNQSQGTAREIARWTMEFSLGVADNTGGRALVRSDNIEPAISQMFLDTSFYYLIGVEPRDTEPDGRFHDVSIEVTRPNVDVRGRRGYYYDR